MSFTCTDTFTKIPLDVYPISIRVVLLRHSCDSSAHHDVNQQGSLPVNRHYSDKQIMTFHRTCPPHFQSYMLLAALRLVIELSKQRETGPLRSHSTQ